MTFVEWFAIIFAMRKIKVGVIGVGHLGVRHAQIYQEIQNCSLVGVCDINRTRLNEVSQSLNVTGFTDYKELLDKVDAVSIAAPTISHYGIASDFLKNNIHALVEKPFTKNLKEAQILIKIAQKNKLILPIT